MKRHGTLKIPHVILEHISGVHGFTSDANALLRILYTTGKCFAITSAMPQCGHIVQVIWPVNAE